MISQQDKKTWAEQSRAFSELLTKSRSRVFGYLYAIVLNMADAEDLFQQVSVLLWNKFDEFDPESDFQAWAIATAHYCAMNFVRSRRRSRLFFSEEALQQIADSQGTMDQRSAPLRSEALEGCLDKLPESERRLVRLCYEGKKSMKTIAREHGRSEGAVYKAISRIRKSLYLCIERTLAAEWNS